MNSDDVFLSTPTTNKFDISKILNTKTITTTESTNFPSDNVLKRHNGAAIHLASPPTDEGEIEFETIDGRAPLSAQLTPAFIEQLSFEEPKLSADVLPSLDNYPTPPPVPRLPNLPTLPSFFRDEMPHSMHLPNSAPLTLSRTLPPVQMVSNSSNSGRSPSSPLKTPISAPQLSSSRHPTPIPRDDRRDLRYVPYAGNGYYEDIAYQNPSRMSMPGQAPR